MHYVYLLAGSNAGNREKQLEAAQNALQNRVGSIERSSDIFESAAWGIEDQADFLNQAYKLQTSLSPQQLMLTIKDIEVALGRTQTYTWGPREIDIDILLYDDLITDNYHIRIPHPELHKRRFALVPLAQIAPDLVHPVLGETIAQILEECTDQGWVKPFSKMGNEA